MILGMQVVIVSHECYILQNTPYKENDCMVQVFHPIYGKLNLVFKGALKPNAKNAGTILPYCIAKMEFEYQPHKSIFSCRKAIALKIPDFIFHDLLRNSLMDVCRQLLLFSMDGIDESQYPQVFERLCLLNTYMQQDHPLLTACLFVVDMLQILGIPLYVDGCLYCDQTHVVGFSVADGGYVCTKHIGDHEHLVVEPKLLKNLRWLSKAGLNHIEKICDLIDVDLSDLKILLDIYTYHFHVTLSSLTFLEQIFEGESTGH